ncbi:MAG: crossover junction endodeoxyribonuclease RuvC [Bacteroidales bacterium]|nr:crossover junction endodeoxyribonuclease RuvC [Bacteroidales bacterium]
MLILGIDPGTRILGYSLLEVNETTGQQDNESRRPRILAMDVLYLRNIADFNQRIRRIFDSTLRIIDSFHPDHLAIEAPFFGKNVQSMLKLGRAQGVAIAAALSRDLSYTEYEPSVIKQLVTGNGNASKEQVATMLRSILGFDDAPKYLDATDALAVAYTCHMQFSNPLGDLRSQLMPKTKRTKSRKKQWAEFVNQNPDIVN